MSQNVFVSGVQFMDNKLLLYSFFPPVQTGPGAHPASCKMGTGSFPGVKCGPGCAADHSPPSSAAVMEE